MAMVCPQCNTNHEQHLQCPACGTRLVYHDLRRRGRLAPNPRGHWMQSPAGRVVIGLVLAQGLFFGLRHLALGFLMASQGEEAAGQSLQTMGGLVLRETLQLLPLLLGAMLAGSGQRHGFLLGFVIGLGNCVLCRLGQLLVTHEASALSWYVPPLLQGLCGALGGWIGSAVWRPAPTPNLPTGKMGRKLGGVRRRMSILAGRVAWVRVTLGALLAVAGSLWAEHLLQSVINASAGKLDTSTRLQDELFTWEIRALAILLGGALAGATTGNGIKQGLCVGIVACLFLLAIPRSHATGLVALLTTISTFTLSVAGGWFGSQLLPPVVPFKKPSLHLAP